MKLRLVGAAATAAYDAREVVPLDAPWGAVAVILAAMFAGSIIEAVWPLGCPVRLNLSPVALSTSELEATSTRSLLARRKSTPRMAKETSARRKDHSKPVRPPKRIRRFSPQHRIGRPFGPVSQGSLAGGSLERWGTRLKDAPVSTR